jgi:hypothetical protein
MRDFGAASARDSRHAGRIMVRSPVNLVTEAVIYVLSANKEDRAVWLYDKLRILWSTLDFKIKQRSTKKNGIR